MNTLPERVATLEANYLNLDERFDHLELNNAKQNEYIWNELHKLRQEVGIRTKGMKGILLISGSVYVLITGDTDTIKEMFKMFIGLFK